MTRHLRARQLRADTCAPTFTRTTYAHKTWTRTTLARKIKSFPFCSHLIELLICINRNKNVLLVRLDCARRKKRQQLFGIKFLLAHTHKPNAQNMKKLIFEYKTWSKNFILFQETTILKWPDQCLISEWLRSLFSIIVRLAYLFVYFT